MLCFIGGLAGLTAYFVICRPEGYVLMANAVYGNRIAFLITSFLGSFLVLGAAEIISKIKPEQKLLPFIGRNTMGIFILHKPVVELMRRVITHFGYGYNNIAMMILIPVIALCIVLPVLVLMQRFTPFMFGQIKSERSKS